LIGLADVARAHDWYSGMKSRAKGVEGYSCCSGNEDTGDCRPVPAWMVGDRWRIRDLDGREYDVPDDAIHDDAENLEPFQASACIWHGRVICFWRKRAGG
jgi:hypothetical protein